MELNLTTPALLFPGISLLLLAYTNRFITLAGLVRTLHHRFHAGEGQNVVGQIRNLRTRLRIIVWMQAMGVTSFFLCVVTMLLLFVSHVRAAEIVFVIALAAMLASLAFSLWEVRLSIGALHLQLEDMEGVSDPENRHSRP